jgi:hypothetical protein
MKPLLTALVAALTLMAISAGTAIAAVPGPIQSATQSSDTGQAALAASSATQVAPSNENISVRVLSPGNDGPVTQSNSAASSATATNTAPTTQTATQDQGAGCGCSSSPVQSAVQGAQTGQLGAVLSGAQQLAPANGNDPADVGSSGAGGPTSQSNSAASSGEAQNTAPTSQSATQSQDGSGVQSADQSASTGQLAGAASSATQIAPSNENVSVRVLSPGNDGPVTQSNSAASSATATNTAPTTQTATQSQGGSGVQSADQSASTDQAAIGLSSAKQIEPSNKNVSVRVLSPGNDGAVSQSNSAASSATSTNDAPVTQTASQASGSPDEKKTAPCGCDGHSSSPIQAVVQDSHIGQGAFSASEATQVGAENVNAPVRIWSPGNGGPVTQSNSAASSATSTNSAPVTQTASQVEGGSSCGCDGHSSSPIQVVAQESKTGQIALSASEAKQIDPKNVDAPVRIGSWGNDGPVTQSNSAASSATSTNTAATTQDASQEQGGSSCGCGLGIQALGQSSKTIQLGGSFSSAFQKGAKNDASPVRIWSPGNGGAVSQSNSAASSATTDNTASTDQTGSQTQSGGGIQALAQDADTFQAGLAVSKAVQLPGHSRCGCGGSFGNEASPVRIGSWGDDGSLSQSNSAASSAESDNTAETTQDGRQQQGGSSCGCHGLAIQALGQHAGTFQLGAAFSSALQVGASNTSSPFRIWSPGVGVSPTWQGNSAASSAGGSNLSAPSQLAEQTQV